MSIVRQWLIGSDGSSFNAMRVCVTMAMALRASASLFACAVRRGASYHAKYGPEINEPPSYQQRGNH